MAIELKSIRYSRGAKVTAGIIIWLFFMGTFGSSAFLLFYHENLYSNNYFKTNEFKMELARLVHNTVELNVILKSEEKIKASGEAENIISDKLERLHRIQNRLSKSVNYAFYINNKQTGEMITNITDRDASALIQKQSTVVYFSQWELDAGIPLNGDIKQMLSGTQYEIYAAVIEPLKQGDVFYDGLITYSKIKQMSIYVIYLLVASIILLIIAFIYLACVTGRLEKGGEIGRSFVDRIYTDVYSLSVFIAAIISISVVGNFQLQNKIEAIGASIVLSIDVLIGLSYVLSMIRQIKSRQIIKNSFVYKTYKVAEAFIKLCFSQKVFKVWTLFLLLGYGMINAIFAAALGESSIFLIALLIFNIAAIYFATNALLSLTQIMGAVKEISTGNLDYAIDSSKISVAFSGFAGDIQSIQGGLQKAVVEAVKGERMKTDLITNVSHDLKTPLTSIINYVDLLKRENLNKEKVEEYVGILEEKSARLKQLIEDLVEASKASSGNLAVKAEKVDLHELVLQACGEYEEKLRKAELDIRISTTDKKTIVFADGKYMWRIVENLFSNIIKYSMSHSRVYININISGKYGLLTIKNISAFPLEITPEQLTARFVRGDVSRTTEGSGLGLSIAQSLTNIQGGRFKLEIDGDLFKVIVEMPLWLEM